MSIFSITSSNAGAGRDRLPERIQVDDHEVERLDPVLGELLQVLRLPRVRQQAAVDPRMQRLHASVEHLGEPGHLLDRP